MNRRSMLGTMFATVLGGKQAVEQVGEEFSSKLRGLGQTVANTQNYPQTDKPYDEKESTIQRALKMEQEKLRITNEANGEFMGWKKDKIEDMKVVREFHSIEALKSVSTGHKFIMARNLSAKREIEHWKKEAKEQLLNFDKFWGILK